MQTCKTVTLRLRKLKGGDMLSFYLDYYPAYRDQLTMELRRHESLGIYIYAKPKNSQEKEFNNKMASKAEAIRCRRYESIVNERFDFFDTTKQGNDFLEYYRYIKQTKDPKWNYVYQHFKKFVRGSCTYEEVTIDLCRKFREYLLTAKSLSTGMPIKLNSVAGYWSTFRGFLKIAYRDKVIKENLNEFLEKINTEPVQKESLSLDELRLLYQTPCEIPVLKKAAIFACLTGMRRSDIIKLDWSNIHRYADGGWYVEFYAQKTKERNLIPISKEAYKYISDGTRRKRKGTVFEGFDYTMANLPLKKWLKEAGITKRITFHSFRHTFASLEIELGTDVYTVMRLLAHKSVTTTQIYACHADPKRREAAERISSKLFASEHDYDPDTPDGNGKCVQLRIAKSS